VVPTVLWVSHCKVIARYIDCQGLTELCVIYSTNFSNSGGRGLRSIRSNYDPVVDKVGRVGW